MTQSSFNTYNLTPRWKNTRNIDNIKPLNSCFPKRQLKTRKPIFMNADALRKKHFFRNHSQYIKTSFIKFSKKPSYFFHLSKKVPPFCNPACYTKLPQLNNFQKNYRSQ